MKVKYIFADGRETECTLPLTTPLSILSAFAPSNELGLIAMEILSVGG